MAVKIIRHRLFTWFEVVESPVNPDEKVLTERIAHMGQEVDVTNDKYVQRGEGLGSFYSDEQADQIRAGIYRGPDAAILYRFRSGDKLGVSQIEAADGEGPQTQSLTVEELAEYIRENRLNVDQTIKLAGDDVNSIERVLDAENIATDNDPRAGVVKGLEARLQTATAAA